MKQIQIKNLTHYLIDENGNVFNSNLKFRPVKSWANKNTGYMQVILQNRTAGLKPTLYYIHRLVAQTYLDNELNLPEVNHKDFNRNNNSVSNLEWVSKKENVKHKSANNRLKRFKTIDRLSLNKELIQKAIYSYYCNKNINYVTDLLNCGKPIAYQILKKHGVDTSSLLDIPQKTIDFIHSKMGELNNIKQQVKYLKVRYGIQLRHDTLRKIKNNLPLNK
jgi:hypothetical protein